LFGDVVVSGGLAGTSGTLLITQPPTVAWVLGQHVSAGSASLQGAGNSDNYVDLDTAGNYHVTSVANGASAPPVFVNSLRLSKAITNATVVSSVVDLRPKLDTSGAVLNVKSSPYNAKGDGSTDDAAAIQGALDAAFAIGGTVLL